MSKSGADYLGSTRRVDLHRIAGVMMPPNWIRLLRVTMRFG
ncbi:MAG: hypothetical protein ABSH56_15375 [Bryobacteraceae bacterium]